VRTIVTVAVLLFAAPAMAQTRRLPAAVTRVSVEPTMRVAARAAGATVVERYRSPHRALRPSDEVVLIIRLPPLNSPDVVTVVSATAAGKRVRVALETRRFTGPLAANDVTEAFIEVSLGRLGAGRYDVRVREQVLAFDVYDRPDTANGARAGLGGSLSFEVR